MTLGVVPAVGRQVVVAVDEGLPIAPESVHEGADPLLEEDGGHVPHVHFEARHEHRLRLQRVDQHLWN